MENSIVRAAANNTPSRHRTMTLDGTPRKAPLSAKKTKPQVCERLLASGAVLVCSWLCLYNFHAIQMDRFIPARSAMDLDVANFNLLKENNGQVNAVDTTSSPKVCL